MIDHAANGNLENSPRAKYMFCMMRHSWLHRSMTWSGMGRANASRLIALHSMDLPCPLVKYSHRFTLAKDATITEDDWLDAFIICIERSTTTSSEEALHGNGTTSFPFRSDKKSLMCLKRLATFRGI